MAEYSCEICKDKKAILKGYKPDGLPRYERCVCATKKIWANRLGPQIWMAKAIKESALEKHLEDNLFIRADNTSFFSHLRCTLIKQGEGYKFHVMNDAKIFQIWLGKDKDYDSLQDLVPYDLLIITMGATIYENKAHAAVMQEAVHVRLLEGRPTWIQASRDINEVLKSQESAPEHVAMFKDMIEEHFKTLSFGKVQTLGQKSSTGQTVAVGTPPSGGKRRRNINQMAALSMNPGTNKK